MTDPAEYSEPRRRDIQRRLHRAARIGALYASVLGLVFYAAFLSLYLLPENAVKILNPGLSQSFLSPFFSQNWHLFAPRPPTSNRQLHIQIMFKEETPGGGDNQPDEELSRSPWYDVTTELLEHRWENPLSPAALRRRTIMGIAEPYLNIASRRRSDPDAELSGPAQRLLTNFYRLLRILGEERLDAGQSLVAVRGRIQSEPIPPFRRYGLPSTSDRTYPVTTPWWRGGPDP